MRDGQRILPSLTRWQTGSAFEQVRVVTVASWRLGREKAVTAACGRCGQVEREVEEADVVPPDVWRQEEGPAPVD